jgi:hypothetical protein
MRVMAMITEANSSIRLGLISASADMPRPS